MVALRQASTWVLAVVVLSVAFSAAAVETGPVDRKWGLGWDDGLTARLWLGGVWELAVAAGPQDRLEDYTRQNYDTGEPPSWSETQQNGIGDDRIESGFVRAQVARLVARRGPVAAVCFTGLEYAWSDASYGNDLVDLENPSNSYTYRLDRDTGAWILSLGLRPSFEVLDFLTIELAFGLAYRWTSLESTEQKEFTNTGRVQVDVRSSEGNNFDDVGWTGMGSLQFFIWF